MVIYEITAMVDSDVVDSYERYMIDMHIPDLLATGCFRDVRLARSASGRYRVHYCLADRETLELYLRDHAPRLRDDFARHFPSGIEISRENWEVVSSWDQGAGS